MITTYFIDIIILMAAAVVAVPLAQFSRLGAVSGFLIAGAIVGPYGFSLITHTENIIHFAEFGVVLLLFVIGMELKPSRLWQMRRLVFGLGTAQVLLTGVCLTIPIHFFFQVELKIALLIGMTLALSSTAFVLQLLTEQKKLISSYGRTSVAILLLQDLAVVPLLLLVPLLSIPELTLNQDIAMSLLESLIFLTLAIVAGHYLLNPMIHRIALSGNSEIFSTLVVLIVLGGAFLTEHIGLSMAMGAFLAGLMIADSAYRHHVLSEIKPFRGLLLGLFFISTGMLLNINVLIEQPMHSIGLLVGLLTIKCLILLPLVYWFTKKRKLSLSVSLLLAQSGEFALIILPLATRNQLLSEALLQQLLLVVVLSMLTTPMLAHFAKLLINKKDKNPQPADEIPKKSQIVIAGFGRVGEQIGHILSVAKQPFIALDSDAHIVKKQRSQGQPVYYGDVCNTETLNSVGIANAKHIIITLNDQEATKNLVSILRGAYPKLPIYARGHSLEQCQILHEKGASEVVAENIEASLELAHMVLLNTDITAKTREKIIGDVRKTYHKKINRSH